MSPIQQMLLGVGAVATKTYVDDVFSTFLYTGNASDKTITNSIDLAGEGGLTWIKRRNGSSDHALVDTVRGASQYLSSNSNAGNVATGSNNNFNSFTSTGFTLKDDNGNDFFNKINTPYSSWSFRKAPGFFDVVTYTGNGNTPQAIAHNLGSMPGMVIVKKTSASGDWMVWHRDLGASSRLELNQNGSAGSGVWGATEPTSTHFYVAGATATGASGSNYIAYVFAGGESTAATARSVDFDGSGDYLSLASTTDLNLTGDFTIEFWVYPRNQASGTRQSVIQTSSAWGSQYAVVQVSHPSYVGKAMIWDYDMNSSAPIITSNKQIPEDQWTHVAFTRSSGTIKIWINGTLDKTATGLSDSIEFGHATSYIANHDNSYYLNAKLSNFRIVKGTAVYTSSFRPPTEPLTNITNTKLLCCNNSSTTGKTVGPTITANGDPTASTDSSFDDPAGFSFGESGSENVIKCGSYKGSGTAGLEVNVGFEPQWVLFKNTNNSSMHWRLYDSMRGIVTGSGDIRLMPNLADAESSSDKVDLTSTGFKLTTNQTDMNENGSTIAYIAIRRPDGYCGKLPSLGTDVFAMDTGNSSTTIPALDSGFPVDFALGKYPATSDSWGATARLTGTKYLVTDTTAAEASYSKFVHDSNVGIWKDYNSTLQSWMWKRHAGFDVVTYEGDGVTGRQISHNLSKSPEMMWIKNRSSSNGWIAFHKGLGGGTNPSHKFLQINSDSAEADSTLPFNDTEPTSTNFTVGGWGLVNNTNDNHIAMLFASISGISAVGSYTGNGSSSGPTITTGFTPRFILIKSVAAESWYVLDTLRGLGTSSDKLLRLDRSFSQGSQVQNITTSSTGFTIIRDWAPINQNNTTMLYYAHA